MHKRNFEAQLGRPPNQMEVFVNCYKNKEDPNLKREANRGGGVLGNISEAARVACLLARIGGGRLIKWYYRSCSRRPIVG
ncbi:UNVERIFIED_CONTAM: hypothetical protein Sradi_0686700 [Sesamum radiatum]|uniref:Uncharacterized protein n=1 Tax=Sesamum radiatum TaxID=300843 RepID=A0AAW2VR87_SESRA